MKNGYICFYKGSKVEVYADTLLEAKELGVAHFKAKKSHMVTAVLAEKNGKQVTHSPAIL